MPWSSSSDSSGDSNSNNVLIPKVPCYGSDSFGCDENDCIAALQQSTDSSKDQNSSRGRRTPVRRFTADLRAKREEFEQAKASFIGMANGRSSALEIAETDSSDWRPQKKLHSDDLFISRHPSYTIKNVD